MKIVGVIDLLGGHAVRAVSGPRDGYRPVNSVAGVPIQPGDAVALASLYKDHLGVSDLYVADLDAILGRAHQEAIVVRLAALGMPLWLDAGIFEPHHAQRASDLGAAFVIVGLETLRSFESLDAICQALGGRRIAFGLDLRNGQPLREAPVVGAQNSRSSIVERAVASGAGTVMIIDLARVGTTVGPDVGTIASVRTAAPYVTLLAGGGIRGMEDVNEIAAAGCDGALVATALQDGSLTSEQIRAASHLARGKLT